jgi:hypothetical protein
MVVVATRRAARTLIPRHNEYRVPGSSGELPGRREPRGVSKEPREVTTAETIFLSSKGFGSTHQTAHRITTQVESGIQLAGVSPLREMLMRTTHSWLGRACFAALVVAAATGLRSDARAQGAAAPEMLEPTLGVRTAVAGLNMPIGLAFLGANDMFVIEKDTGRVQRVVNGAVTGTVLDLGVNNNSERGLLGIALHPDFPRNPGVYLYWTCRSTASPSDPFFPDERRCLDANMFAADSSDILQVPLLGNRVDRFVWDGSRLSFHHNVIMLRAFQNDGAPVPSGQGDGAQPARANHNGGVIRFGPDRKLYIVIGDNGRRGWLQNLVEGPVGRGDDDQFGGPEPDDMLMAAARPFLEGGHLFDFILSNDRREIVVDDPRIEDRVADNRNKWEVTESETLLIGRNFGVGTDIQTGPNGNVFVVSLTNGAIYEIFRARQR